MKDMNDKEIFTLLPGVEEQVGSSFIDDVSAWFAREEEANRYKVITLCGSHKFKEAFSMVKRELTMQGYIVIDPYIFNQDMDHDRSFVENNKDLLASIHEKRILMSDGIYVVNVDGYIGEDTEREIQFAIQNGKFVMNLVHDDRFVGSSQEDGCGD